MDIVKCIFTIKKNQKKWTRESCLPWSLSCAHQLTISSQQSLFWPHAARTVPEDNISPTCSISRFSYKMVKIQLHSCTHNFTNQIFLSDFYLFLSEEIPAYRTSTNQIFILDSPHLFVSEEIPAYTWPGETLCKKLHTYLQDQVPCHSVTSRTFPAQIWIDRQ